MKHFSSNGYEIAYLDEGEGPPILLIHGFGSSARVNWVNPGWVDTLTKAGRRVIALDNRGHGHSAKPHEVAAYRVAALAEDARNLLAHLGIAKADVMGYSMGARISAFLALAHPELIKALIFGGLGYGIVTGIGPWGPVVEALETEHPEEITDPVGLMFRKFADQTKSDRVALAACMKATRVPISADDLATLHMPVLIAVGERDELAGSPERLAEIIPGAAVLEIPKRDHMLAVGDKVYKAGVLDFLARQGLG
ncbi:alpha/beta hydrolase [Kaistia dalseonensis]|uniref:Pimeloyl-ACP methyl ester carboxylesterase n=1 Tax=Kaistia dalseonensis TaxID=410840 RepID=A0ABU0HB75_9HYPH|nr:alpha/beta hydrolase [Kaistia dalseonensis]MCX5496936.1 alpha/beta hydrolase [Kaistia dalseonensis]MDQ0439561.1 pimeloyl-ACP methyl ester carboxylesterase [Kaistia dalseonensis]